MVNRIPLDELGFRISPRVLALFEEFQSNLSEYIPANEAAIFARIYTYRSCDVSITRHYPRIERRLWVRQSDLMIARLSDACPKDIWDCCRHKEYRKDNIAYVTVFSGDAERLRLNNITKASDLVKGGYTPRDVAGRLRSYIVAQGSKPPEIWFEYITRKARIWIEAAQIYLNLL